MDPPDVLGFERCSTPPTQLPGHAKSGLKLFSVCIYPNIYGQSRKTRLTWDFIIKKWFRMTIKTSTLAAFLVPVTFPTTTLETKDCDSVWRFYQWKSVSSVYLNKPLKAYGNLLVSFSFSQFLLLVVFFFFLFFFFQRSLLLALLSRQHYSGVSLVSLSTSPPSCPFSWRCASRCMHFILL